MTLRNTILSIALVAIMIFGFFVALAPVAKAEDTTVVYHRTYSQIPTIRLWNDAKTQYYDLPRGQTTGNINQPINVGWVYIPTGWCFEENVYRNGNFIMQIRGGPGPSWNAMNDYSYYSVFIYNPGSDGDCFS